MMTTLISWTLTAVVFVLLALTSTVWGGYVVATLWGWFAVPLGAPEINLAAAIGLVCLMMGLRPHFTRPMPKWGEPDHGRTIKQALLHMYATPAWLMLIGWCAHTWGAA